MAAAAKAARRCTNSSFSGCLSAPGDLDRQIALLLERGVPVDARDSDGYTPLMLAAMHATCAEMRVLLDRGADPNALNELGFRTLALVHDDVEKWKLLLDRGADPKLAVSDNGTAILDAATFGRTNLIAALLDRGLDPNECDDLGRTALQVAVENRKIEAVRLLVERGAEARLADHEGQSPLDLAKRMDDRTLLQLLATEGELRDHEHEVQGRRNSVSERERTLLANLESGACRFRYVEPGFKYEYEMITEVWFENGGWQWRREDTYTQETLEKTLPDSGRALSSMYARADENAAGPEARIAWIEEHLEWTS